ncbi:MAG: hypothetical protein AB7T49_19715 [Oligoflexales bacterium]
MDWKGLLINQIFELSTGVQIWMGWMVLLFAQAIPFCGRREAKRFLACLFATLSVGAILVYSLASIHALAYAHLICWPPYLFATLRCWQSDSTNRVNIGDHMFRVWLNLLILTMCVSLALDIRDIFKMLGW